MINLNDILISGYYGFKNSGDDTLLLAIIQDLTKYKPDVKIAVLSKTPAETAKMYNVKAVNRLNPFAVILNIIKTRLLLSGGGTLIQDGTSTKSLFYYLFIIETAHIFGKKVMLYSNGIGPLTDKHRKITAKILNKTDIITLRDEASLQELASLGVTKPKIILTADPAFDIKCKNAQKGAYMLKKAGISEGEDFVCVSVRSCKGMSESFTDDLCKAADYICEKYHAKIVFLPMQAARDNAISHEISQKMKNKSYILEGISDIDTMLSVIARAKLCIGMRLHSLIYAVSSCVPSIGLVYDVKVAGFMDYIGQRYYLENISDGALVDMIDECMQKNEQIRNEISQNLTKLRELAESNARYATELLEKRGRGL